MTQWDIEDITPALRNSPPDRRNQVWRNWYNRLVSQLDDSDYRFMNYGYLGLESPKLEPSDEANRIFIELYQVTLGDTSLTDKDVLDISSGLGGGAYWISRICQPSSLVGIDLSPEVVRLCNKWYHGQQNLRFVVGDAEALPFPDDSFDVIYNVEASHCYANYDVFLREVFRVLRTGGYSAGRTSRVAAQWKRSRQLLRNAVLRLFPWMILQTAYCVHLIQFTKPFLKVNSTVTR